MSRPLAGLVLWLTRPQPSSHASQQVWQARGAEVLAAPTVRVIAREPEAEERSAVSALVERLERVVVALPSPRAAENFVRAYGAVRPNGVAWTVAALGDATATRAVELGLSVQVRAERALGPELARTVVERLQPQGVLLPSSDRRRPELGAALREAGVEVLDLVVHCTVPIDHLPADVATRLRRGEVGLLVAYSPSSLDFVEALAEAERGSVARVPVACLGPTTASRASELGLTVAVAPDDPGEPGLIEAACHWYAAR